MSAEILGVEQEPEKTTKWNAQRLIFQRKKARLTHKQLAEIIGVSRSQIICMENCSCIPSEEMLDALVSFFDVPEDYFGLESLSGPINAKPARLSPQEERQQAAKARLTKQRQMLRKMMKTVGFPLSCTGLHYLAEAIDEPLSDTCKFVNGELAMPSGTVHKIRTWFASAKKTLKAEGST